MYGPILNVAYYAMLFGDELREDWKVWDPSRALGRDGFGDQIQV